MNWKLKVAAACVISLVLLSSGCSGPVPSATEYEDIDTSGDPVQTPYDSNEIITIRLKDGLFKIKPVETYEASVKMVSKETYSYGWAAKISPIDLAFVWGKLADSENEKYITYSQSGRWYFFEYKPGTPFAASYIINHSSNNHIIPATDNILRAIKTVKAGEKIILKGFLVNLTGTYEGQNVWWSTSLSRNDTGEHSCELFYVSRVRIGNEVYE